MNTASPLTIFAAVATCLLPAILRAETISTLAPAHVRLWKTDLPSLPHVRVALKTGAGKHVATHDLAGSGSGYQFNSYADTASGHGTLEVYANDSKTPLLSQPVDFAPGAFLTVLLSEPEKTGNLPRLEVIEDRKTAHRAQFTVRTFVGNLKDMQIKVGDSFNAQFVAGDSFLQMRGLKAAFYSIHTTGTGPDDKPFEWTNETDLRQHSCQTLLVYPDPYGRVRPRLIVDGENLTDVSDDPTEKR